MNMYPSNEQYTMRFTATMHLQYLTPTHGSLKTGLMALRLPVVEQPAQSATQTIGTMTIWMKTSLLREPL
jgi:hypothetical protein